MDDEAGLAEIRSAAQATLDAWPEARAAVLFGSRARGNHRPDSDWDVAFIVRGDGERLRSIPPDVPFSVPGVRRRHYVNEIAIPERLFARKALCIGHVGRGIVVDGKVLAGDWSRPKPEGMPFMEPERYTRSTQRAVLHVGSACGALATFPGDWEWWSLRWAAEFVACAGRAAEQLGKAVMGRHGLDAYGTHSLDTLADQAREVRAASLADDFLRMNGATRAGHAARLDGTDPASLAQAIARLAVVLDVLRNEMHDLPEDFPAPQARDSLSRSAAIVFSHGAATLRDAVARDGADLHPPEPYGWLKPLVAFRGSLAAKLDATAEALRADGKRVDNDGAHLPEPSPLDDPTDPFRV